MIRISGAERRGNIYAILLLHHRDVCMLTVQKRYFREYNNYDSSHIFNGVSIFLTSFQMAHVLKNGKKESNLAPTFSFRSI